jgi:hypothetical protein
MIINIFCLKVAVNGYFKGGGMQVLNVKENDDGTATLELQMSQEELWYLVEYAVVDLLRKEIERRESKDNKAENR